VRVRDIGQAVEGAENARLGAWANGRPAVLLIVLKQPGANVIDTVGRVMATLPSLRAAIPPTVDISVC
jgi:multidrug efflux pump subunit AcrB